MRDEIEDHLRDDPLFQFANWDRVWKALPVHSWTERECGQGPEDGHYWRQQLANEAAGDDGYSLCSQKAFTSKFRLLSI